MKKQLYTIGLLTLVIFSLLFFFLKNDTHDIKNAPPKNSTIVAFGDSLIEGVGSERGGGFVSVLQSETGIPIINEGVAGDTSAMGLLRIEDVLEHNPGIVLVLFGGNDALRRVALEETEENLASMISTFHDAGAVVVLLGVRGGIFGDPYDQMYEELSDTYHTAYVPNVLEGILLRSELTYDQLHPNDSGYRVIAERIQPILTELMEK